MMAMIKDPKASVPKWYRNVLKKKQYLAVVDVVVAMYI